MVFLELGKTVPGVDLMGARKKLSYTEYLQLPASNYNIYS
jgi:hypothetical protein